MAQQPQSVLVLGANGRTGLEVIRTAANLPTKPAVHAFLRTPSKLPQQDRDLCAALHQGDATVQEDLQRAIDASKPQAIIVALGVSSLGKTTVLADSARALLEVIKPGSPHENVRVAVVSSNGAADTKMKFGAGLGAIMHLVIKNILRDHTNQENILRDGFGTAQANRLLIVRPTALKTGKPTGKVATFTKDEWPPTARIDRADVAQYIWEQLMGDGPSFGSAVSITTAK